MKRIMVALIAMVALSACSKRKPTEGTVSGPPPAGKTLAFIAYHVNAYNQGIMVVDISIPTNPSVVCSLLGYANQVDYLGNTMLTNSHSYNIIDPSHPVQCSTIDTLNIQSFALQGTKAYCGCDHPNNNDSLVILDVNDPAKPTVIGSCKLPTSARGVAIKDQYVYTVNGWFGLCVFDVADSANPHQIANLLYLDAYAEHIALSDHFAFVSQQSKVSLIDISQPLAPVKVAVFENAIDGLHGICVQNYYIYIATSNDGLRIVDFRKPGTPQLVGELVLNGGAYNVAVAGSYAYVVGTNGWGLRIVDIRNKANPVLLGTLLTDHSIFDIALY